MSGAPTRLVRAGLSAVLVVALMVLASVGLWVGVPVAWLWVGGRVEGATQSLGAAVGVMFAGAILSIALFVPLLGWLNHKLVQLRAARGLPEQRTLVLEAVLVVTAAVAAVLFSLWFFVFAGANPIPFSNPL